MLGDHSIVVPPDPIPNSAVKRNRADGSVGSPHARVGHRQAFIRNQPSHPAGFFVVRERKARKRHCLLLSSGRKARENGARDQYGEKTRA